MAVLYRDALGSVATQILATRHRLLVSVDSTHCRRQDWRRQYETVVTTQCGRISEASPSSYCTTVLITV